MLLTDSSIHVALAALFIYFITPVIFFFSYIFLISCITLIFTLCTSALYPILSKLFRFNMLYIILTYSKIRPIVSFFVIHDWSRKIKRNKRGLSIECRVKPKPQGWNEPTTAQTTSIQVILVDGHEFLQHIL